MSDGYIVLRLGSYILVVLLVWNGYLVYRCVCGKLFKF